MFRLVQASVGRARTSAAGHSYTSARRRASSRRRGPRRPVIAAQPLGDPATPLPLLTATATGAPSAPAVAQAAASAPVAEALVADAATAGVAFGPAPSL